MKKERLEMKSINKNAFYHVVNSMLDLWRHDEAHGYDHKALRSFFKVQIKSGFPADILASGRNDLIDNIHSADMLAAWVDERVKTPINWIEDDSEPAPVSGNYRHTAWMNLKAYGELPDISPVTQTWRDLLKEVPSNRNSVPWSKGVAKRGNTESCIVEHNPPVAVIVDKIVNDLNTLPQITDFLSTCREMFVTLEEDKRIPAKYKSTIPANGDCRWELAGIEAA
jgi:hypothetical protein